MVVIEPTEVIEFEKKNEMMTGYIKIENVY